MKDRIETMKLHLNKPLSPLFAWVCLMIVLSAIGLLGILLSSPGTWRNLFFLAIDPTDSFMDFFNPIYWNYSLHQVYGNVQSIYPPFITLVTGGFSKLFPQALYVVGQTRGIALRSSLTGQILFAGYSLLTVVLFFIQLFKAKTGLKKEKWLFCLCIAGSYPFLFWAERANYILLAIMGSLFFVQYYDHSSKKLRHWALFLLAVATAVKVYPAALGMLLVKEKRWKDICIFGVYALLLSLVPLIWLGGWTGLKQLWQNIQLQTSHEAVSNGFSIKGLLNFWVIFLTKKSVPTQIISLGTYLSYGCFLLGVVVSYFLKSKWKTVAVLCLMMILIPAISYKYVLLILVIPLVLLLNKKQINKIDLVYLFLFAFIFAIKIPFVFRYNMHTFLVQELWEGTALFLLFILLCLQTVLELCLKKKAVKRVSSRI